MYHALIRMLHRVKFAVRYPIAYDQFCNLVVELDGLCEREDDFYRRHLLFVSVLIDTARQNTNLPFSIDHAEVHCKLHCRSGIVKLKFTGDRVSRVRV